MKERTKLRVGKPSKSITEKLENYLKDEEPMSQISLRLSADLHSKLKIYTASKRISIKDALINKIKEMVSEEY